MQIRVLTMDDYDAIYTLWQSVPGVGLNNIDDSREGIERYLCRNPETCFLAEENGELAGCVMAGHDGRRGYIYHLTVSVDHQRKGIGRVLVDRALQALEAEGITKVALVVFARNEMGNEFWEKIGFTTRPDIVYRNKTLVEMIRFDT
ncbi:MAG: GNAT family N-acetyltransferase [Thermomicrobiales bacterium]|nr:GNAT family N-acetyltransferase [Thermomicrobiales bacterium]